MSKTLDIIGILFGMKNERVSKAVDMSFKRILNQIQARAIYPEPDYRATVKTSIGSVTFWHMNRFYGWLFEGSFDLMVDGEKIKYSYRGVRPSRITMLRFYLLMRELGLNFPSRKEHDEYVASMERENAEQRAEIQKKIEALEESKVRLHYRAELLQELNAIDPVLCGEVMDVVEL